MVNIESLMLSALILSGDLSDHEQKKYIEQLINSSIDVTYFDNETRPIYKFCHDHLMEYKKLPSSEVINRKFSQFEIIDVKEPLVYYIDELKTKKLKRDLIQYHDKLTTNLHENKVLEAWDETVDFVTHTSKDIKSGSGIDYLDNVTEKTMALYNEREMTGGISGILTHHRFLDTILGGIKDVDLISILGYTNVGKTWLLLLICALMASRGGTKCLVFTSEMTESQLQERLTSLLSLASYQRFKRGSLTREEKENLRSYLQKIEDQKRIQIRIERTTSLLAISAIINSYKPDIVFIDGAYLMTSDFDNGKKEGYALAVAITQQLKKICISQTVPILFSWQNKVRDKATLDDISFAKAMAQDCDAVFAIEQTEEEREVKQARIATLKLRDSGDWRECLTEWDFAEMRLNPITYVGKTGLHAEVAEEDVPKLMSIVKEEKKTFTLKKRDTDKAYADLIGSMGKANEYDVPY